MRAVLLLSLLLLSGREGSAALTLYRIACGSATGGIDPTGVTWQPDAYFTGGARWTAANQPALSSQPIPFQSLRYGATFSYSLPVAAGTYDVTLRFIEIRTDASVPPIAAGQRQFSVSLQGSVVAAVDIFAQAPGSLTPMRLTYQAAAPDGRIQIDVAANIGNAVLSGIQVDTVDVAPEGRTALGWMSQLIPGPDFSHIIPGTRHGMVADGRCPLAVLIYELEDGGDMQAVQAGWHVTPVSCDVRIEFAGSATGIGFGGQRNYYVVIK